MSFLPVVEMLADIDPPTITVSRVGDIALRLGQWCAVGALLAVTINKPATNVLLALGLMFSLVGTDAATRWRSTWKSPITRGFLLWGAVLAASATRSPADLVCSHSFVLACTYPLIVGSLLTSERWGRRAMAAFALAVVATMLVSFGMDLELIPQRELVANSPNFRNTVFKEYTHQAISTLIVGCMAMAHALVEPAGKRRACLLVLALAAGANVAFVLGSRTGHLILVPLIAFWGWRMAARYPVPVRAGVATFAIAALVSIAYLSPMMQERVMRSLPDETSRYVSDDTATSTGVRIRLWERSLELVAQAPVLGHGLGQWEAAYRQSMKAHGDNEAFKAGHPHQEMLLVMVEQGIAGLAIYLALLGAFVRYVWRLSPPWRDAYLCIAVIYITAGLAHGLWADFTHRHVFVLMAACLPALASNFRSELRGT